MSVFLEVFVLQFQVSILFDGHPDLLDEFTTFIPEAASVSAKNLGLWIVNKIKLNIMFCFVNCEQDRGEYTVLLCWILTENVGFFGLMMNFIPTETLSKMKY